MSISALYAVFPSHNGLWVSSKPPTSFLSLLCRSQKWLRRTILISSDTLWTSPPWPASQQGERANYSHFFKSSLILFSFSLHFTPGSVFLMSLLLPSPNLFLSHSLYSFIYYLLRTCLPPLRVTNLLFYDRFTRWPVSPPTSTPLSFYSLSLLPSLPFSSIFFVSLSLPLLRLSLLIATISFYIHFINVTDPMPCIWTLEGIINPCSQCVRTLNSCASMLWSSIR